LLGQVNLQNHFVSCPLVFSPGRFASRRSLVVSVCPQGKQSFSLYGFGSGQIVSVLVAVRGLQVFVMALAFYVQCHLA